MDIQSSNEIIGLESELNQEWLKSEISLTLDNLISMVRTEAQKI